MPMCYVRGITIKYLRVPEAVRCKKRCACGFYARADGVVLTWLPPQVLEKVAEEKVKRSDTRPGGGGRGRGGRGDFGGRGDGEGRGRGSYGGGRGGGRGEGRGGGRGRGGEGRGSGRGEAAPEWA